MVNNSLHINDRIFKQELQLENYLPSLDFIWQGLDVGLNHS